MSENKIKEKKKRVEREVEIRINMMSEKKEMRLELNVKKGRDELNRKKVEKER
jgi:hypothetical protein